MRRSGTDRPSVAIACQGGGSHTAFTAGVLDRLLEEADVDFDVVGLSGTSGGAICAFATWFALASEGREEGRNTARGLLASLWDDIAATATGDALLNDAGVGVVRAQGMGVPLPSFSPYVAPVSDLGRERLLSALEAAVPPDALARVVGRETPRPPRLDVGAVDVQRGTFRTFTERDVSHGAVLASAAVPNLFRAAPVADAGGTTRYYWDGLFSQNPPLKPLLGDVPGRLDAPDELWIVTINPRREAAIPTDLEAISDRRNELAGNLSVTQELGFVRTVNRWVAEGELTGAVRPVDVKTIDLDESALSPTGSLDYASKLDRTPAFLDRLWAHGRERAERFLAAERDRRRVREALGATWRLSRDDRPDERVLPTFVAHVPAELVGLRSSDGDLRADGRERTLDREAVVGLSRSLHDAMPDLTFHVEETVTEPGAVATRWRATGTHEGTLLGVPPTERTVTLSGLRIDHLVDGRLSEAWIAFEQWSLLRQLDAARPSPVPTTRRVAPTPVVTQLAAPAETEALARLEVEGAWTEGRREVLDRVLAPDCVLRLDAGEDLRGRDGYWAFVRSYRDAFPDLSATIEDVVSECDKVVLRLTLRGTHEGSFLGVAPTGRRVTFDRLVLHHLDDGRIVETGFAEDTLGLLDRLGVTRASAAE
jgi:NTE family protein